MLTRRDFAKRSAASILVISASACAFEMEGCGVIDDIENWIPVGEATLNSIVAVLGANGITISPVITEAENVVNAALAALKAGVAEYNSTSPAPVGALAKVQGGFKAVTDAFQSFLSSLNIPGGSLLAEIVALVQIIFSTIAAFQNQLPSSNSVMLGNTVRMGNTMITYTPKHRTRRRYKHDYNSQLDAGKKIGVNIPQQAYMKLSLMEHL